MAGAIAWSSPTRALCEDLDVPDPELAEKAEQPTPWNGFDGRYFSMRIGGGMLIDYSDYEQGDDSEQQMDIFATGGIRDLRLLFAGRLISPRLTYTAGYMYDGGQDEWFWRQTGLKLEIPQLSGYLFVGRTKEGFSTNKMMVGYHGWFNERSAANDAFIPILADGARWTATAFDGALVYNVGGYADALSESQSFNKNDWQFAGRIVWLPIVGNGTVLHLATEGRYAGADDGELQFRSKPEAFLAQSYAVDTGKFEASRTTMLGFEAYFVSGPFAVGSEYFLNQVSSTPADDPFFHGGEAFAAYMLTGETHPYNVGSGIFTDVVPARDLVSGGPGAWEVAVRASYVDLDSGPITGGTFFRITPFVNWYATRTVRFEAAYGYGILDRMGMDGGTHFFQTRMQLTIPTK